VTDAQVELRGISKSYPGVRALREVDFELRAGEVHALAGHNGAGKSTLARVIGGVERPDAGSIRVRGREVAPRAPLEALRHGIAVLHQETHLVPQLSVAENFFLGREIRRRRFPWGLDWRAMRERTRARLAGVGLDLDVDREAGELSAAHAQLASLARALDLGASAIVLDEPTSSLGRAEVERLLALVRDLARRGLGVVFVAHSLDQVDAVADRITVLRDGTRVATRRAADLARGELIELMLGPQRAVAPRPGREGERARAAPCFEARGLGRGGAVEPFDLALAPGEVVGLAGLLGSGRTALLRCLAGADRAASGAARVDGAPVRLDPPRRAIARGIVLLCEDRKREGLFPSLSLRDNVAILSDRRRSFLGVLAASARDRRARELVQRLRIAAASLDQPAGTLSGGNQQKALFARALAAEPRLLLLDDPTRGVDVGAKAEIRALIAELAARGVALVVAPSELEELLDVAERALVLRDGRVVAELVGAGLTADRVLAEMARSEPRGAGA
jgi:simple sugar transport system ATP-binding protein